MSFVEQVEQMTQEHGRQITYRRVVEGIYNAATRKTVSTTTTDFSIMAAVRNMRENERQGIYAIGDRVVKFAGTALPITPRRNDKLVIGGKTYRVHSVDDIVVGIETVQYRVIATGDAE